MKHTATTARALFSLTLLLLVGALPVSAQTGAEIFFGSTDGIHLYASQSATMLVDGDQAESLAYDREAEQIYWFKAGYRELWRADSDGSNPVRLLSGLDAPRGLALDLTNEKIYWSSVQEPGGIFRANLDGSNEETVLAGADNGITSGATDVALDVDAGMMYWVKPGAVMQATMDGANPEPVVEFASYIQPTSVAFDPSTGYVYWANTSSDEILRADVTASTPTAETVADVNNLQTIKIAHGESKLFWLAASYTAGTVTMANMDGSNPVEVTGTLENPTRAFAVASVYAATANREDDTAPTTIVSDAYPNPFRAETKLTVETDFPEPVQIEVYDLLGRRIERLHEGTLPAGTHTFRLNGSDLPSGLFFVRVTTPQSSRTLPVTHVD